MSCLSEITLYFLQSNYYKFSKTERSLLETILFMHIFEELYNIFNNQHKTYQNLLKNEVITIEEITEKNFLRLLINDILSTNEYTLEGIAHFTNMPLDSIVEIVSGLNTNPSLKIATKIIKLHSNVRRELYNQIIKKLSNATSEDN